MSIAAYLIVPPHTRTETPAARQALAGCRFDESGQLVFPPADTCGVLIYQDAHAPAPGTGQAAAEALAGFAVRCGAGGVWADLERPPDAETRSFLKALEAALQPHSIQLYLPQSAAELSDTAALVLEWRPWQGQLETYLRQQRRRWSGRSLWAAFCPEAQLTALPCKEGSDTAAAPGEIEAFLAQHHPPVFFDAALCCNYALLADGDEAILCLYDTAATLGRKTALAQQAGLDGVFLLCPEQEKKMTGSLPEGKEPGSISDMEGHQ